MNLLLMILFTGGYFPAVFIGARQPKPTQPATIAPTVTPKIPSLPPLVRTKSGKFRIVALPAQFTVCGVNNKGEIAGTWLLDTEKSRAALWRKGAVRIFSTFDKEPAHGAALNDASQIAGSFGSTRSGAFTVWTGDVVVWQSAANRSVSHFVGHLPELSLAEAHAVNGRGHVVGSSQPSSIQERGPELAVENVSKTVSAFFSDGDKMTDLGNGTAYGINDREQITGTRDGKIVLWQEKETLVLGTGEGRAINNRSQIVGSSTFKNARPHAMLWERGVISDLGLLPGTIESEAVSINDRGQVVGNGSDPHDNKKRRAFLWQNGAMVDLNALIPKRSGWVLREARSINNKGQIVGSGTLNGKERSFLMTPR